MTHKKRCLCALLCLIPFILTGCMSSLPEEKKPSGLPLPEVRSGPEAPVGDRQTRREYSAVLYLPDAEGQRLTASVQSILVEPDETKYQAFIQALLEQVNSSSFAAGAQELRLSNVSNAVKTTGNLATVNMHASMLFLSDRKNLALRMAIVNTLTELPEIKYVNILINDGDMGMDVAGTMPTGVMQRYPGTEVDTHLRQMESERASEEGDMTRNASLYFVSEDGSSLLGEVRSITLRERNLAAYATALLDELGKGPMRIAGARTLVPPMGYFERDPALHESDEGKYIELYFRPEIYDYLTRRNSTQAMLLSSICYTLTNFIPRLDGIRTYVDGNLVTEMTLMNGEQWVMQSGQMTRESVVSLAADTCTVYYPLASGTALYPVTRSLAQRLRTQPRALMRELLRPPGHDQLSRAIPQEVTDADILGLQIQGDTALLNVTAAFAQACSGMDAIQERNLVYAIVNTLTEIEGVDRVRFFVEGMQSPLAGHLFMSGEFLRHTGLIYTGPF